MVVVTHEMGFAREVGDQLVFMDGGVVVEAGRPTQVLTAPNHERTKLVPVQGAVTFRGRPPGPPGGRSRWLVSLITGLTHRAPPGAGTPAAWHSEPRPGHRGHLGSQAAGPRVTAPARE